MKHFSVAKIKKPTYICTEQNRWFMYKVDIQLYGCDRKLVRDNRLTGCFEDCREIYNKQVSNFLKNESRIYKYVKIYLIDPDGNELSSFSQDLTMHKKNSMREKRKGPTENIEVGQDDYRKNNI